MRPILEQNMGIIDYLEGQIDMADAEMELATTEKGVIYEAPLNKPYLGDRRVQLLEQGIAATKGDRNKTHGDFHAQHVTAAKYIQIYLEEHFGIEIYVQSFDVAAIESLIKQSRMLHGEYNPDDYVDAAVYITGIAECIEKEMEA